MRLLQVLLFLPLFCIGQNETFLISDAGNYNLPPWKIITWSPSTNSVDEFTHEFLNWPQDFLLLKERSEVIISNLGSGCINRYDLNTGKCIGEFACGLSGPTRMTIGPDSLLYVLQWRGSGHIKRFHLDGSPAADFGRSGFPRSIGICFDDQDRLYLSVYDPPGIFRFSPDGSNVDTLIDSNLGGPTNLWMENGSLVIMDYKGGGLKNYTFETNELTTLFEDIRQGEGYVHTANGLYIGDGVRKGIWNINGEETFFILDSTLYGPTIPNAILQIPLHYPNQNAIPLTMDGQFQFGGLQDWASSQMDSIIVIDPKGQSVSKGPYSPSFTTPELPSGLYYVILKLKSGNTNFWRWEVE